MPAFLVGALTACVVLLQTRQSPWRLLKHISWSVLPLVAGLFVLVEGLIRTGVIQRLSRTLTTAAAAAPNPPNWAAGTIGAAACNLINNLPAGLIPHSLLPPRPPAPP